MKTKNSILLLLLMFGIALSHGQNLRISEDSSSAPRFRPQWGRNQPNMISPFASLNWAVGPEQPGAAILIGQSFNFRIGAQYKRKITSWFSIGVQLAYSTEDFYLSQDSSKILPDTLLHSSEWFNLQNFVAGGFLRFNLDPHRGNHYGTYIELGVNHVLIAGFFHSVKEKLPTGETQHIKTSGMPYTLPNYGEFYGKFAWRHVAVIVHWRFTPLFKNSYGYPDLPAVKVGLEGAF